MGIGIGMGMGLGWVGIFKGTYPVAEASAIKPAKARVVKVFIVWK